MWATRRTVRPLEEVSSAAALIADGALTTRLAVNRADREVQQLTESFNEMVSQLVQRLERDARFASDVSHELRSPLTTLATTASVLQQHRDELSPAAQESLDLLVADLSIFQSLVEDLLEMARSDAGAPALVMETSAIELVRQAVRTAAQRHGSTSRSSGRGRSTTVTVSVDRRRFERVITNLHRQRPPLRRRRGRAAHRRARRRAGRSTSTTPGPASPTTNTSRSSSVSSAVARPTTAASRAGPDSASRWCATTCAPFGGTITVTESPEGGARFQILLPVRERGPVRGRVALVLVLGALALAGCTLVPTDGNRRRTSGAPHVPFGLLDPTIPGTNNGRVASSPSRSTSWTPRDTSRPRVASCPPRPVLDVGAAPTRPRPDEDRVVRRLHLGAAARPRDPLGQIRDALGYHRPRQVAVQR